MERSTGLLALVHTDVCGPFDVPTRGNFVYFITFTDDLSRYGYVYLMRHKSEAFEKFKEFRHEVEKQTEKPIKVLRSDRGDEYLSRAFLDYLKQNGIPEEFWFKKFATKIGVMPSDAIPLYCDNNDTIALAKKPRSH